jgi:hypothetical protein
MPYYDISNIPTLLYDVTYNSLPLINLDIFDFPFWIRFQSSCCFKSMFLYDNVLKGGGDDARKRHLSRNKLLPRDRIQRLLDPG